MSVRSTVHVLLRRLAWGIEVGGYGIDIDNSGINNHIRSLDLIAAKSKLVPSALVRL